MADKTDSKAQTDNSKDETIISTYLNKLAKKTSEDKRYIYRGQSANYENGVVSTAHRRFEKSGLQKPSREVFNEYHEDLVKDAKSYRYGEDSNLSDIELLFDLQHYGAATGLIDFSEDFLIALWFACEKTKEEGKQEGKEKTKEDGKVFFLDVWTDKFTPLQNDTGNDDLSSLLDEDKPFFVSTNFKNNNRIFAQKGVFVFNYESINEGHGLDSITIENNDKKTIRTTLKKYFNIEEKTLFQDIYGFARVNNVEHPLTIKTARDYFEEAYDIYNKGEYQNAIDAYKKAIEIKDDYYEAYYNMGVTYEKLKQYQNALDAYQKAIKIQPDSINFPKGQDWSKLENWVNDQDDSPLKQQNISILAQLK